MSLLHPDLCKNRIFDISADMLKSLRVKVLLLDVDNTLTIDKGTAPDKRTLEWIEKMQEADIKLMIISNGKRDRLDKFAKAVGLECHSMAMKPLPFVLRSVTKQLADNNNDVWLVGDQIFTDILGANLSGIHSILLTPIQLEDSLSFRIRRYFEKGIRKNLTEKCRTNTD